MTQIIDRQFTVHAATARCIAWHESRFNRFAVSPTSDYGVFQIRRGLEKYGRAIYNAAFNALIAYRMSSLHDRRGQIIPGTGGRNWLPWTTHRMCGV